jgi:hypothetical protein
MREKAGAIADGGWRMADLTAKHAARPAATEEIEPRISRMARIKKIFQRKVAKAQRRKEGKASLPLCSAIYENSAFCAKFSTLCFLCLLLFMLFGCGLPRCALAPLRLTTACPSVLRSSRKCAILRDYSAEKGHFGGTPKWAGETPALPMTFSVFAIFAFFVVKKCFMRLRRADLMTGNNGDSCIYMTNWRKLLQMNNLQIKSGSPN